ncbi:hypothetical protein [Paenibacillus amylolyticus]|jgi:hypothetical protein|uniref:hypothetical protein n=1 Tax=Paenibacillus amylolyticus TaxID=1451 RepID=UPI001960BAA8|nr:hypothetical protein [Paenibacillus amylolyticus]
MQIAKHKERSKKERLLLQYITLRWEKEVRGAPFTTARNDMEKAFRLPDTLFSYDTSYGLPYHRLVILQNKRGFEKIQDKSVILKPTAKNCKLGCIVIDNKEFDTTGYDVTFTYSPECGKPVRYDKRYRPLIERAFGLTSNEYGRVLYNGRHIYQDTGEWYYELNILNMLLTEQKDPNVLIDQEPLNVYNQIEILY